VPNGTLIAGSPVKSAGIVYVSHRYIASGSAVFEPNGKATLGEVGVTSTSIRSYALAKSRAIKRRMRSALP
jgi:hypothetical protein